MERNNSVHNGIMNLQTASKLTLQKYFIEDKHERFSFAKIQIQRQKQNDGKDDSKHRMKTIHVVFKVFRVSVQMVFFDKLTIQLQDIENEEKTENKRNCFPPQW
jgi:hypothetical protein